MRRVISAAVVAAGALALCLLVPAWVRQAAILLAAVYACREAVRMAGAIAAPDSGSAAESRSLPPGGLAVTIVVTLLVAGFGISSGASALPIAAMAVLAVYGLTVPATPRTLGWLGAIALAALWIGLPAAALLVLNAGDGGGQVLLFLLATVMVGEAGAFCGGKVVGGPRLAPSLSPGKTRAGFAAQLIVGGAAGAAAVPLLPDDPGPAVGALLGVWISAAAALGDLFESFWKRAAGRKDSGRIIPGHGGLLDRIDGVLFGALALAAAAVVIPF